MKRMKHKTASFLSAILAVLLCCSMFAAAETPDATDASETTEPAEPAVSAWDGSTTKEPSGAGTEEDPYLISCAEELAYLNKWMPDQNKTYFAGQYFRMTADIDCNGKQMRIGTSSKRFGGTFDGDGYSIRNTAIKANVSPTGLFASTNGATIRNLNVYASSVYTAYATESEKGTAGMLAGFLEKSSLIGCTVGADCTVAGSCYVGGLVGKAKDSVISACVNNADVQTVLVESAQKMCLNYCVGGILGYSLNGGNTVTDCANFGNIQMNIATVKSDGTTFIFGAGGIAGYLCGNDRVTDCFNCGDVSGVESVGQRISVGGIAGRCRSGEVTVSGCYMLGGTLTVEGKANTHVGLINGFVNANTTLTLESCAAVASGELEINGGFAALDNLAASKNSILGEAEILELIQPIRVEIAKARNTGNAVIGYQETPIAENGTYGIRFLLGIDSLQYQAVQLLVTAEWTDVDGTAKSLTFGQTPEKIVYSDILADGKRVDPLQYTASYFAVCAAEDLPAGVEITFTVQAFLTDADAEEPTALPTVTVVHQASQPAEAQ